MYGNESLSLELSRQNIMQQRCGAKPVLQKKAARARQPQKFSGAQAAKFSLTLGEWIAQYLSVYARPNVQPGTFDAYKHCAERLAPLYSVPLRQICAADIDALYSGLAEIYKPATVKLTHRFVALILKKALALQLIERNPLVAVTSPRAQKRKLDVFTDSELRQIFSSLLPRSFRLYLRVLLFTGMRPGETSALRYASLDLAAGVIHVTQTLKRFTGTYGAPKTAAGVRDIPVPRFLLKELLADGGAPDALIFPGNYHQMPGDAWLKLRRQLGLNKPLYAFRHTYATRMLASGIPVLEVSRCMGHSSPSITLNVYGHVMPGFNEKIAAAAGIAFSAAR